MFDPENIYSGYHIESEQILQTLQLQFATEIETFKKQKAAGDLHFFHIKGRGWFIVNNKDLNGTEWGVKPEVRCRKHIDDPTLRWDVIIVKKYKPAKIG